MIDTTARPLAAARDAHSRAHEAYRMHVEKFCPRICGRGGLCPEGVGLRDDADAAGRRWEYLETGRWPQW